MGLQVWVGEEEAAGLQGWAVSLWQLDRSKGSVRLLVDTGMSTMEVPPSGWGFPGLEGAQHPWS